MIVTSLGQTSRSRDQMCQNRFRSITRKCIDLPSSYLINPTTLASIGTLLIVWSLGQRSRSPGSSVPKPLPINNSRTPLTYLPHTLSTHPSWVAEEPFWLWCHWVKGQCHRGQMCKNRFRWITRERLDLSYTCLVHSSTIGSISSSRLISG